MRSRIPKEQIEFLGQVPLFSGCSRNELRAIAQLGTPVGAEEGAYLTRQGKPGREFFLVLDGTASCRVRKKEVKRFRRAATSASWRCSTAASARPTSWRSTPMELLVFDAREFRTMLMTTPSIGVKMLANLAERLAEADAQYTD